MHDLGDYIFFGVIIILALFAVFLVVWGIHDGTVDGAVAEECRSMGYDTGMETGGVDYCTRTETVRLCAIQENC